jgi:hypothetical protein
MANIFYSSDIADCVSRIIEFVTAIFFFATARSSEEFRFLLFWSLNFSFDFCYSCWRNFVFLSKDSSVQSQHAYKQRLAIKILTEGSSLDLGSVCQLFPRWVIWGQDALLTQVGQCVLTLFLWWSSDGLRLSRQDAFQTTVVFQPTVFHTQLFPSCLLDKTPRTVPYAVRTAPPSVHFISHCSRSFAELSGTAVVCRKKNVPLTFTTTVSLVASYRSQKLWM